MGLCIRKSEGIFPNVACGFTVIIFMKKHCIIISQYSLQQDCIHTYKKLYNTMCLGTENIKLILTQFKSLME